MHARTEAEAYLFWSKKGKSGGFLAFLTDRVVIMVNIFRNTLIKKLELFQANMVIKVYNIEMLIFLFYRICQVGVR